MKEVVVAITGASGSLYALRLMEELNKRDVKIHLVMSQNGYEIMKHETGSSIGDLEKLAHRVYDNEDLSPAISSGSVRFHAMAVVPCSMNTLSKISGGVEDTLITRVAAVALKERRKLILVPRETPLTDIHLDAMARLFRAGATIMPAMPGFYNKPTDLEDIVMFMVGRILDHMDIEHNVERWSGAMTQ